MVCSFARVGVVAGLASLVLAFAGVAAAAPSNDSLASPVVLSGTTGSVYGSNVGATFTADEPAAAYWSDGATVWFAWDAPQNGTLQVGADADWETTHLAVFAGTPNAASDPVASDYYGLTVDVTGGTRYYIAVDTEWSIGDFFVTWSFAGASAAANDMWSFAQAIDGASGSVSGTSVGATAEAGEPAGAGHSVWFHWIAPQDAIVSFSVDHGQTVAAYTGWSLGELKPVGATVPVAAGDVLFVRVDAATPAPFALSWQTAPAPAPIVTVPATIVVDANAPQGRTVAFAASAVDWKGRSIAVRCGVESGYVFPIGTTTVTCGATDVGGRTASASFDVHVKGVAEQLADLRAAVAGAGLDPRLTDKLTAQLDDVARQLAASRTNAVCGGLVDFVDSVRKESGKGIPTPQADAFATAAWRMRAVVNCA
jgi:hypothetical protein